MVDDDQTAKADHTLPPSRLRLDFILTQHASEMSHQKGVASGTLSTGARIWAVWKKRVEKKND